MELRLQFDAEQVGRKLKHNMDKAGQKVREAMLGAANDAARQIKQRGMADIASAGKFGSNWTEALHTDVTDTQRTVRVGTSMVGTPPVIYWRTFEYGAHIVPKRAEHLWIPFSGAEGVKGV